MSEGKKYIKKRFPNIIIYSDEKNKIFHPELSPLKLFNNLDKIQKFALKYGSHIKVMGFPPFVLPHGYDKSEALISFFHCTPNNTLPIIWGDTKWTPLFPRKAEPRMKEAKLFKKDIAFMIGIYNRLGIDLFNNESIIIRKNGKSKREIRYNSKLHHSIVALLKLKKEGYEDIVICHVLGLTMGELLEIYSECKTMKFISKFNTLEVKADLFLKELYSKTRNEKFRKETEDNLKLQNSLYLPKEFRGET